MAVFMAIPRPRDAIALALWTCALAAAVSGVHGGYAEYVGLPLPLNGDSRTGAAAPEQELRAGARRHSASSGYGSTPLQAGSAQGLWHENQQIQWNPARLFRPDESLSFQYIKAGGVDLHFLDHTHLEGFDAQVRVSLRSAAALHRRQPGTCRWRQRPPTLLHPLLGLLLAPGPEPALPCAGAGLDRAIHCRDATR